MAGFLRLVGGKAASGPIAIAPICHGRLYYPAAFRPRDRCERGLGQDIFLHRQFGEGRKVRWPGVARLICNRRLS